MCARVALLMMLAALALGTPVAAHAATSPVRFDVRFAGDARLGRDTSVTLGLRVDPGLAPVTEFRVLTPAGIDLALSRLGAQSCRRPASAVADVLGPVVEEPCPANALMGTGVATANLVFDREESFPGAGRVSLFAGASVKDHPGLVAIVNTYNPARMQLTYAGYLYVPPPAFGLGIALLVSPIPEPPFGAPVALSTFTMTIGGPSITYVRTRAGRRQSYHPGGIPLPDRCSSRGFRFRVILRLADGSRRMADDRVPCPAAARRG